MAYYYLKMTVQMYKRGSFSDEFETPVIEHKKIMSLIYTFICMSHVFFQHTL